MTAPAPEPPSFAEAVRVWVTVGLLSFGGPAGQIATMHRILVEERKWVEESRFLHALNFCMLLPGPEAQQLATYLGWLLHRTRGGLAAGLLFILPGFLVMMGLSALYVGYRHLPVVDGLFYGLKPAVLAVVIGAVLRIGRRALAGPSLVGLAAAALIGIFIFDVPFPAIMVAAGLLGYVGGRLRPRPQPAKAADPLPAAPGLWRGVRVAAPWLAIWLVPVGLAQFVSGGYGPIALFFSKMAVVSFGGAYAVLAYVAQQAVQIHHWLSPTDMLNGLGLAETTPGPLILVNQFVGFVAGYHFPGALSPWAGAVAGAALTVWATFAPTFLWVFVGAPYVEVLRRDPGLTGALAAITAAVVGVMLNLALWFALHVVFAQVGPLTYGPIHMPWPVWSGFDPGAAMLALFAMVAMLRFGMGMVPVLAAAALTGLAWRLMLG
jgi:chromate transporter